MSSEIYELMKRSDEGAVVEKAHRRPRFVEDCVREMIAGVVAEFGALKDSTFVSARQENLETIHQHRRARRPGSESPSTPGRRRVPACSASYVTSSSRPSTSRITPRCASGSTRQ